MHGIRKLLMLAVLLSIVVSGAFAQDEEYAKEVKERILKLPQCSRPMGVITAKSFKCKAAACQGERVYFGPGWGIEFSTKALGDGLADMLITALANTNCFKVVERIALEEIKEELELMGVKPQATLKTADYIITGAVTALELKASGLGGGGVVVPLPFGLGAKFGKSKAHIALDMRIVQVKTGEILSAKTVEGKSERWNIGIAAGGLFGSTFGGAYFEAVKNTPLEEATRDFIVRAVALIVESVKAQAPADVVVGEKVQVYNDKGEIVKEEVVMPKATVVEAPTRPEAEPSPSGGLVRESVEASSYPKILWHEDFSTCKVVPTNIKIIRGQGECVGMGGKKWLATTKGELVFERNISGFDPTKNFTVEGRVYYSQKGGVSWEGLMLYIGKEGSPVSIELTRNVTYWKYGGTTSIPNHAGLPDVLVNKDFKFMLKKEGELVHLFINGTRVLTTQIDTVALKNLPAKIVIKMFGNDIGEGSYVLLTDLRITSQ